MPRNIILTSLEGLESDRALRYYSVRNEFGFKYCEAMQSMEASTKYILSHFPVCSNIETVQNVLYAYFNLGSVRNKISHSDSDAMAERRLIVSESDISFAMLLMKQSVEYFIMCYEKAIEETQGKKLKIVKITSDDVHNTAESIKRRRNQNERSNHRENNR